ncbi:hypothetical protein [Candidatus Magnetomonas plexicatena]|uniref:hypothetical protein n=1 Tax=Candidatus Magnetomonas plexicatena TaxID=2552947 RepID=UPI001C780C10|nr:hypothetical protein E2O03_006035 [Nitrospirales bacterium LBB_01]
MQAADKNEIKKIVVEVLDEILAQTQPPDRLDNCLIKDTSNDWMVGYIKLLEKNIRENVKEEINEAFPAKSK